MGVSKNQGTQCRPQCTFFDSDPPCCRNSHKGASNFWKPPRGAVFDLQMTQIKMRPGCTQPHEGKLAGNSNISASTFGCLSLEDTEVSFGDTTMRQLGQSCSTTCAASGFATQFYAKGRLQKQQCVNTTPLTRKTQDSATSFQVLRALATTRHHSHELGLCIVRRHLGSIFSGVLEAGVRD